MCVWALTLTCIHTSHPLVPSHMQRHSVINVLQPGGCFDLSHCVHVRQAPGIPPFSDLLPGWSDREQERYSGKESEKKRVLLHCDLSPGPAQGAGLSPLHHMGLSAAWCVPPVLFQLSGYSPKPKGVFNLGLGITGLTVNSSRVKGLGRCPKPSMFHAPLA